MHLSPVVDNWRRIVPASSSHAVLARFVPPWRTYHLKNRYSDPVTSSLESVPLHGLIPEILLPVMLPVRYSLWRGTATTQLPCVLSGGLHPWYLPFPVMYWYLPALAGVSGRSVVSIGQLNCSPKLWCLMLPRVAQWSTKFLDHLGWTWLLWPSIPNHSVKLATVADSRSTSLRFPVQHCWRSSQVSWYLGGYLWRPEKTDVRAPNRVTRVEDIHRFWSLRYV